MHRRAWILAAVLLVLPACEGDKTTDEDSSIAGTYTVQTVDGHALPYTVDGEVKTAGTLVLKSDNTWTVSMVAHFVSGGDNTFTDHGTYTYISGDLALKSATDAAVTHGTISGSTITVNGDDGVYVLKKN